MPSAISQPLILFGGALLFHACYSAHEHYKINDISPSTSNLQSARLLPPITASLPPDISLETIVSVFLICLGLVLGAEELQSISWRVWARKAERDSGGGGPFQALEDRIGFMDIRRRLDANRAMIYRARERTLRTGCGAVAIQQGSDAGLIHPTDYRTRNGTE